MCCCCCPNYVEVKYVKEKKKNSLLITFFKIFCVESNLNFFKELSLFMKLFDDFRLLIFINDDESVVLFILLISKRKRNELISETNNFLLLSE